MSGAVRASLCVLTLGLLAPALEAAPNAYVSTAGRDTFPCTRARPCRTFARAVEAVDAGGHVLALDSGRFASEALDIRKSVTLEGAPGERAELSSPNGAVYVNVAADDVVVLRHLAFVGQPTPPNNAIIFNGGTLHVEDCVVSGFPTKGILALGAAGRRLFVKDSLFRDNFIGVSIDARVVTTIDRCRFEHNQFGLAATVTGRVTARDSVAAGNAQAGFLASGVGANAVAVLNLENCMATANGVGVQAGGILHGGGLVRLSNCVISDNTTGVRVEPAGVVATRENNTVAGNDLDVDGALTPFPPR